MNNPGSILNKLYPLGATSNKIYSRISRMEAKHYCPNAIIIDQKNHMVQKFVVNKEKLGEFFRVNKVTHIFINEIIEKNEDKMYKISPFTIVDKSHVVINCILGL